MSFLSPSATESPPGHYFLIDADGTHPSAARLPPPPPPRHGETRLPRGDRGPGSPAPPPHDPGPLRGQIWRRAPSPSVRPFRPLAALWSPYFRPPRPPNPLSYSLAAVGRGGAGHLGAGGALVLGVTEIWPAPFFGGRWPPEPRRARLDPCPHPDGAPRPPGGTSRAGGVERAHPHAPVTSPFSSLAPPRRWAPARALLNGYRWLPGAIPGRWAREGGKSSGGGMRAADGDAMILG